jgi:TP901 family phage tail tape measure protein
MAGMTNETRLRLSLEANTAKFRQQMGFASQSMYAAGGAMSRLGTIARGVLHPVTLAMTATAISAKVMGETIMKASKLYVEFNDTLARTGAILGESSAGMEKLESKIREVGRTTRFTASEVGEAANKLAIAGVGADEMISDGALENLVKFAIAGGVDIETATNIGIAGVKAFGMEMTELGFVSDVLTRTFTRSNVDIVSLGEGMKFAAPVAHSAGLAIEETAAAIGALGNAGLRGTVAGTGLRMSINKLLKPTFDAQRAMNDLGLKVQVLSPRGEQARQTLSTVARQLSATKSATASLSDEMKVLNGQMSELSIEQMENTVAIEQIRARAARANRDLTSQEEASVARMQKANENLRLSEMTLDLERQKTQHNLTQQSELQSALSKQSNELTKTVEQQTTGLTSLGDVLDQLAGAGATTTQILEIFGVRGGTAMASLLSQREAFHMLVEENNNAAGATQNYMDALQGLTDGTASAKEMLFIFNSVIQDALLDVGKPFIGMLVKLTDVLGPMISDALKENMPLFLELGESLGALMMMVVPLAIDMIPDMIMALKAIVPIIGILVVAFRILMAVLSPVLQLISGIGNMLLGLFQIVATKGTKGKGLFMSGLKDAVVGGALTALTVGTGGIGGYGAKALGAAGAAKIAGTGVGAAVGKMAVKKGVQGGVAVGASALQSGGASQGNQAAFVQDRFADGGFVSTPTVGLVGEAGPEVVIPLSNGKAGRREALAAKAGLTGNNLTVSIGDIVINGGANLSVSEVRTMISSEMPRILRAEMLRGAKGVI